MARIGFISTMEGGRWGGSEALWSQLAERLLQRGQTVAANVKWWPEPSPALSAIAKRGAEVKFRRRNMRLWRLFGNAYLRRDYRWLDKFQPEFVVLSLDYQSNGAAWMEACAERGIPYALIVQSVCEHNWPGDEHNHRLAAGYARARAIYFVSRGNRDFVRAQLAEPLPQAKVVCNPFNVPYDANPAWPSTNGEMRLACVGRLQPPAKGQDILCEVLKQAKWKERPLSVTLFGAGEWKAAITALAQMYGITKLHIGDYIEDVAALWEKHHALVLPSRYEGLPLVVVEAMLCNRPCIVTDVAGSAELLEDNTSGFVAAAPKASLLDEAMERAWQRREEWEEIGRRAGAKVRKQVPQDPVEPLADAIETLIKNN